MLHAADIWNTARQVLLHMPHPPVHVFGDVVQRWGPEVAQMLEAIEIDIDKYYTAELASIDATFTEESREDRP